MTLEQRTRMAVLYDLYSGLLTDKQRDVFDLYYQCDLSLGEIAADNNISRTAVHDLIKRTESLLEKYEAKLHLVEKFLTIRKKVKSLDSLLEQESENKLAQNIREIAREILEEL